MVIVIPMFIVVQPMVHGNSYTKPYGFISLERLHAIHALSHPNPHGRLYQVLWSWSAAQELCCVTRCPK